MSQISAAVRLGYQRTAFNLFLYPEIIISTNKAHMSLNLILQYYQLMIGCKIFW